MYVRSIPTIILLMHIAAYCMCVYASTVLSRALSWAEEEEREKQFVMTAKPLSYSLSLLRCTVHLGTTVLCTTLIYYVESPYCHTESHHLAHTHLNPTQK